jgi:hypothetical protein
MKMFKIAIGILVLSSTVAFAQQPTSQSIQQTQVNEFVLRLKPNDVNVLGKALGKLPFEEVSELMQSLRMQIAQQQTSPKTIEPAKEPGK